MPNIEWKDVLADLTQVTETATTNVMPLLEGSTAGSVTNAKLLFDINISSNGETFRNVTNSLNGEYTEVYSASGVQRYNYQIKPLSGPGGNGADITLRTANSGGNLATVYKLSTSNFTFHVPTSYNNRANIIASRSNIGLTASIQTLNNPVSVVIGNYGAGSVFTVGPLSGGTIALPRLDQMLSPQLGTTCTFVCNNEEFVDLTTNPAGTVITLVKLFPGEILKVTTVSEVSPEGVLFEVIQAGTSPQITSLGFTVDRTYRGNIVNVGNDSASQNVTITGQSVVGDEYTIMRTGIQDVFVTGGEDMFFKLPYNSTPKKTVKLGGINSTATFKHISADLMVVMGDAIVSD